MGIPHISDSARRLKEMIEKAIEDHRITRDEMDLILAIATEDSHIDPFEQALLNQLQEMIENKEVKIVAS
jgi:3-oxoacyl-[acyl-carrier-protein] synthase III